MTAQGEDLLAYLDSAITKAAGDANRWHDIECDVHAIGLTDLADLLMAAEVPGAVCDCTGPASVLRRCAADRKLVESLTAVINGDYIDDGEPVLAERVLDLFAEGYGWTEGER